MSIEQEHAAPTVCAVLCHKCTGNADKLRGVTDTTGIPVLTGVNIRLRGKIAQLEAHRELQTNSRKCKDRSRVAKEEIKRTTDKLKRLKARLRAGEYAIKRLGREVADRPVSVQCLNCANPVFPCRIAYQYKGACFVTAAHLPNLVCISNQIFYKELCNAKIEYHLVFNVCHGGKEYTGNFNGNDIKGKNEILCYVAGASAAEGKQCYNNEKIVCRNSGNKTREWQ
jgi:hypothetical protein